MTKMMMAGVDNGNNVHSPRAVVADRQFDDRAFALRPRSTLDENPKMICQPWLDILGTRLGAE